MTKFSFADTVAKLRSTPAGKEASMYGPIRDIFIQILKYPAADVDIDTAGESGRPDVTALAPAGFKDAKGLDAKAAWIVVEAKDERGCFRDPKTREKIFSVKSKYVTAHTAWFVMVEPDLWVLRPVGCGVGSSSSDVEIDLSSTSEAEFKQDTRRLQADGAGTSPLLERFRSGDMSLIATDALSVDDATATDRQKSLVRLNRRRFFDQIRETTTLLQAAVATALSTHDDEIQKFSDAARAFWEEFGRAENSFDEYTLTLHGSPKGDTTVRRHDRESTKLKRAFAKSPYIARLAVNGLPAFQARTGADDRKVSDLFAIETANLILARVLLLRFFEDHGFFGKLRYVCNGGVEAFQQMRHYFRESYARLLAHAYEEGSRLYAAAFDATELDWIFGVADEGLSSSIELALFRFARYDFTTIKGDILTGIYDRFMDRDQRKRLGEFYTPPSIARYIIDRCGITRASRILDPACGSGTFLIESYRCMIGNDVERGAADYSDVLSTFSRIAGNDLNTFSSVLTQIQMLWQILGMKNEIEKDGFPDILVTAKVNSLVERDQWGSLDRFAEIDQPDYDAVIGNPPYVRAERSAQALDKRSQAEFERGREGFAGVSSKLNAYALFLYRALDRWAKPPAGNSPAGRVAFIIPTSLFDSNETAQLRSLFRLDGRWAIREIVDLEVIYRDVFDADVLPVILIAENRPPAVDDTVSIRFADRSCVKRDAGGALPEFALNTLPEARVPYGDIFSPDGRILTRVTPDRLVILRKLWGLETTFADVAKPYWVHKTGSKIDSWSDKKPKSLDHWESRRMIAGGVAFRGNKTATATGVDVYKGENIIACELQGDAALSSADIALADDQSLWRYADILPDQGLAVAGVAHCPNCVLFDPKQTAFTNTATILFPTDACAGVPFDLLLLSSVYVWFYALSARMGVLRTLRSHMYPTNVAFLPWTDVVVNRAADIEALRDEVVAACTNRIASTDARAAALADLRLPSLKQHVTNDPDARLEFGDGFRDTKHDVVVESVSIAFVDDTWRVSLSDDLFDWVGCNMEPIARGLVLALEQMVGNTVDADTIRRLSTPESPDEQQAWANVLHDHSDAVVAAAMDNAISHLDSIVGTCLGLSAADVAFIRDDLQKDPFLRGIRPRYPGTVTRKQGFRTGLDAADRYN